jgi:Leucine-rich repeat (LRR) protein
MELEYYIFFLFGLYLFIFSNKNNNYNYTPPIDPTEQEALYIVLKSLNPDTDDTPWGGTRFPADLCRSPPSAVVCHHSFSSSDKSHVVELNFGYVSDKTRTLPCSPYANLNTLLFTSFTHLRKLTFHKCFNNSQLHFISLPSFPNSSLEELVFIDNPSIVSPLQPFLHHLNSLTRLVLVGNGFHGELPPQIGGFENLEELTLARNNLSGEIPASLGALKKLKVLDLSRNQFKGCVPEQLGNLFSLLKLDLSYNKLDGSVPEEFGLLEFANEINLENNNLSGIITFSDRVGQKLKLAGNIGLCLGKNDH